MRQAFAAILGVALSTSLLVAPAQPARLPAAAPSTPQFETSYSPYVRRIWPALKLAGEPTDIGTFKDTLKLLSWKPQCRAALDNLVELFETYRSEAVRSPRAQPERRSFATYLDMLGHLHSGCERDLANAQILLSSFMLFPENYDPSHFRGSSFRRTRLLHLAAVLIANDRLKGFWPREAAKNIAGYYSCEQGKIYVSLDQNPFDLASSLVHELEHLFHDSNHGTDFTPAQAASAGGKPPGVIDNLQSYLLASESLVILNSALLQYGARNACRGANCLYSIPGDLSLVDKEGPLGKHLARFGYDRELVQDTLDLQALEEFGPASPEVRASVQELSSSLFGLVKKHYFPNATAKDAPRIDDPRFAAGVMYYFGFLGDTQRFAYFLLSYDHDLRAGPNGMLYDGTLREHQYFQMMFSKNQLARRSFKSRVPAELYAIFSEEFAKGHTTRKIPRTQADGSVDASELTWNLDATLLLSSYTLGLFNDLSPFCGVFEDFLRTDGALGYKGLVEDPQDPDRMGETGVRPGETGVRPGETGVRPGETGVRPGETGVRPNYLKIRPCFRDITRP